jgi:gamma-glutamylcyclotransferase (GGCT)/AIG2-like uncharacterized protein YtfP
MDMNKLFVYGTLKRAFREDETLGAEYIGDYETDNRWVLFDFGAYPALVPGESVVSGEVWQIPSETLSAIDRYEGQQFARREIKVKATDSEEWEWVESYLFVNTTRMLGNHDLCTTWG